jgi:5-methylcytosine-specific restriction endonuclease McrA
MYKTGLYLVNSKGGSVRVILDKIKNCENCGKQGKIGINNGSLIIHHLDKNRNNNIIKNLMVVCRKCHHKIHH